MDTKGINQRLEHFRSRMDKALAEVPSGATRWLGGVLKEAEPGRLVAGFSVREDMTNPMRILHGGVAAMIMDDMMGIMVYLQGHHYAHTSVNLNCDFLNPARLGAALTATARIIREGRNIVHCECEIRDQEQKLIAKSASNLILTPVPLDPQAG